jgi:hypothetical protein
LSTVIEGGGVIAVSLSGQTGNKGRQAVSTQWVLVNGVNTFVLNANQKRVAAIITVRKESAVRVYVELGLQEVPTVSFPLEIGEHFQIDQNVPWCGDVLLSADGGFATVNIVEVSLV